MFISSKFTSKTEYLPCTHPHPLDTSKPRSADNQHLYLASLMYKAIVCFSHDTRPQREIKQPRHSFAVTQKMLISPMHAHIFKLLKQKDWSIFFSITKEEYPVFDLSNFGYFFCLCLTHIQKFCKHCPSFLSTKQKTNLQMLKTKKTRKQNKLFFNTGGRLFKSQPTTWTHV